MRSSEFASRFQSAGGNVRIKSIGHSGGKPKTRLIGKLLAAAMPTESALLPNYPNPFNPETWIPLDLSEASRVAVTIYNAAGQTVRVLQLGELPAGTYRSRSRSAHWDGRNALGERVASGVYYVRIEAGSFTALRRMVVLK